MSESASYTATTRQIGADLQVSWKKDYRSDIVIFTIGVSLIGGNDIIGGTAGVNTEWNKYLYFDESDHILDAGWERDLNQPVGGVGNSFLDITLDNTSGRFLPHYMGGASELFTAVLPRRPMIFSTWTKHDGTYYDWQQFVGLNPKTPKIDSRNKTINIEAEDFLSYLENRYVDETSMYTGILSSTLMETLLVNEGYATADYVLDYGINLINFALFNKGDKLIEIFRKLAEAENGHFYQDESGKLRFENRMHWANSPHNSVTEIISTGQVINAETIGTDHIINVVEIKSQPRKKQSRQIIFQLESSIELPDGLTELIFDFDDPQLEIFTPNYVANTLEDESGTDVTASVTIKSTSTFAEASKYVFENSTGATAYLTQLTISGRPAKVEFDLYSRQQRDLSVTAYEEQKLVIENDYIQSNEWAETLALLLLEDYAFPENLLTLTIRAIPGLKLGDLVSWQGRYWRVFSIKNTLSPDNGYTQEITVLQRDIIEYFQIGESTIGGSAKIAP